MKGVPVPNGPRPRLGETRAIATAVATALLGAFMALTLAGTFATATATSFSLYGTVAGGWSFTAGGETNPGPTITENAGAPVTVHLISGDLADHGLFIDFNNNGRIDLGTDYSSPVGTDVTFTFTVPTGASGSHYYYCSIHSPDANGVYRPGAPMYGVFVVNGKPSATFASPGALASWTGGTAHNIVFNLTDEDPPTSLTVWVNYSYNGGAQGGTIAGPMPGTANPNTLSWTPSGFSATDVRINVTARDTLGAYGYSLSAPFEVDSTPPAITSRSPAPNAVGVARNTNVQVTWSQGMNATASGASNAFAVMRVADGAWTPGTVTWSPDRIRSTFAPSALWDPTTTFEVHMNSTAKDDSEPGNAFAGPATWRFTTGTTADTTPPTITNVAASPSIQNLGGTVTITADVTDNVGIARVDAHIVGPSTDVNLSMANVAGPSWMAARTFGAAGTYTFTVWAVDTAGNAASISGTFSITQTPVTAPPTDYTIWIVLSAAIVVAALAVLVLRRRKKS